MSEQKNCPVCGKPIINKGSNAQKYCSEACRRKANANVKNTIKHNKDLPRGEKYKIFLAYDCKCAICGWQASELLKADDKGILWGFGNEIHHIKPLSEKGKTEDGNIILLCPNCHKLAHIGVLSRKDLRENTKPIDKTCEEKTKEFWSESAEVMQAYFDEKPTSLEATKKYILTMQRADLIARAGFTKLNRLWLSWVREIEDAAKEIYLAAMEESE